MSAVGVTEPRTFLVCGGRRTGTTLLAAVLSSEPDANPVGPEAQVLTRLVEAYRWGRERFEDFGRFYFGDLQTLTAFYTDTVSRLLRIMADSTSPGNTLILKNPELSTVIIDAAQLMPDCRVVASLRDPRDQVASELEVGARQIEAGMHSPHIEARDVRLLADVYLHYMSEILALRRDQPQRVTLVRYEDLVLRPGPTLQALRDATGLSLPFDPGQPWPRVSPLANLHSGPSRSALYVSPIDAGSVGRFRRDLAAAEISEIERVCGTLMDQFAYTRGPV